jgi:hypothetical protein
MSKVLKYPDGDVLTPARTSYLVIRTPHDALFHR